MIIRLECGVQISQKTPALRLSTLCSRHSMLCHSHSYPQSVCELNLMFLEARIANNLPLLAAWLASV